MYFIFFSVGSFTFIQVTFKDALTLFHRLSKSSWVCTWQVADLEFVISGSQERLKSCCLMPCWLGSSECHQDPQKKVREIVLREKKHLLLVSSQCVTCSSSTLLSLEIVPGRLDWYQLLQEKEDSRNTNTKTYFGIQHFHFYKLDFSSSMAKW